MTFIVKLKKKKSLFFFISPDSGIKVEQGLFISRICPGGVVAKFGMLPCVGDRIINVSISF